MTQDSSRFERWRSSTLAPFEHRVFALFLWATLVSSFGSLIQSVGASWLMATIEHSAESVALVQTAGTLPFFFLSIVAGALADTNDRRLLMLISQGVMFAASVLLAGLTWFGITTPLLLLGMTFLLGCGSAAFAPAWQSSISEQVPRTQVPAAVMANAMGFNLARSVGPAIGGVIVAAFGAVTAFFINAVSYIGMLATLVWWKPPVVRPSLPPEPLGSAIRAGVRYVRLSPDLIAIYLRCVMFTVPFSAVNALMPVVARDLLGGGAPTFGLLLGGFGVGAMCGALSSSALRQRFAVDTLLRGVVLVASIALFAIVLSPWAVTTFLAHVLAGSVWTLGLANFNIAVQSSSPRWVMGRTLATYQTFAFAGMAVGAWIWGRSATIVGVREALTIAACACLLSFVVARWVRVSVASVGALDPQVAGEVLPPKYPLHPASGPIAVHIEYTVPERNAIAFVAAVNELGRIRRRDGAFNWSVAQDIDRPEQWIEQFESPTWIDYLRRQTRPTLADAKIRERLRSLVSGERGSVRRFIERPAGAEPLGDSSNHKEVREDYSASTS
jgi:MFS family permease